jgi:hypothetical protein
VRKIIKRNLINYKNNFRKLAKLMKKYNKKLKIYKEIIVQKIFRQIKLNQKIVIMLKQ